MEETPESLVGYDYSDYFHIHVHYSDTTGEVFYEDESDYHVVASDDGYYIIELLTDLIYPISEKDYLELESLFE